MRPPQPSWTTPDLPAEVHKEPSVVLRVFLHPLVLGLDLRPIEEPQHRLLQGAPVPLPGMISTIGAFLSRASCMTASSARSIA